MATVLYYNENGRLIDKADNMPIEIAMKILEMRNDVKIMYDGEIIEK